MTLARKIKTGVIGIYKIINKIDGKVYIGGTTRLDLRKSNHFSYLKSGKHFNHKLQDAYNKYGKDNFSFEILEYVDDKINLDTRENYWVKYFKSNKDECGYNIRIQVDTNLGIKYSDETKKKISISVLGKGTGKRYHCAETVKLKSEMCKARNLNQYHTEEVLKRNAERMRKKFCNVLISEELKKTLSIHNKGELNHMAKLNDNKVLEILKLLKIGALSAKKIGLLYDVCVEVIYNIKKGKSWMHVTIPFIKENGPLGKPRNKNKPLKITETQAIEIIDALENRKATQKQLAEKYNVSVTYIATMASGATWKNIPRNK